MNLFIRAFQVLIVLGLLALVACTAPVMKAEQWQDLTLDQVWPAPPQIPRVKLMRVIGNQSKFQGEGGRFFEWLLGKAVDQLPLVSPYGIAADGNGRVWVADPGGGYIHIIDLAREKIDYLAQVGTARLVSPVGLAYNPQLKQLYVSDSVLNSVFVLDLEGSLVGELVHPDGFQRPGGMAVGPGGDVYVADVPSGKIEHFSSNGKYLGNIESAAADNGLFNRPTNVAVDTEGRLYVTDSMNFRVVVQTTAGDLVSVIGNIGDMPGSLARPRGLAIDSDGHVYIVDAAFDNIQIFDMTGNLLLFFGQPGKGGGEFCLPAGIFIDQSDRIYLSESCNGRFQIFQYFSNAD